MNISIELPFKESELKAALESAGKGNAIPLRSLCQKEVALFEAAIRDHPDYRDGLVKIERLAVEGYLYQKLRNHINEKAGNSNILSERQSG
jgi:hypothetical protein